MDAACDRFESAWRSGRRPRIEDVLGEFPEAARPALLRELLGLELAYRRLAGEAPDPEEYRPRFPDHPAEVRDALEAASTSPDGIDRPLTVGDDAARDGRARRPRVAVPHPAAARPGRPRRGLRRPRRGAAPRGRPQGDPGTARRRPDSRARFVREAEITGGLEHPGIVPVYGLGRYPDGRPYYAMRFIRGGEPQGGHRAVPPRGGPPARPRRADAGAPRAARAGSSTSATRSPTPTAGGCSTATSSRPISCSGPYGETLVVDWGLAKPSGRPEPAGAREEESRPLGRRRRATAHAAGACRSARRST